MLLALTLANAGLDPDDALTPPQADATLAYLEPFIGAVPPTATCVLAAFARGCLMSGWYGPDRLEQARDEAQQLARSILQARDPQALDLDPLILVSHYAMLRDAGVMAPALASVVVAIDDRLRALPRPIQSSGRVRHIAALLAGVGIGNGPAPAPAGAEADDPHALAFASRDVVLETVDHLWAGAPSSPELDEVLGLVALAELRDYRVDLASKIIRWLLARGVVSQVVRESIAFIQLQRSASGSYGFFDPFDHVDSTPQEQGAAFHIPITTNAVWMLHQWKRAQA